MRFLSLLLAVGFSANVAFATPTNPVNGAEYVTISTPQSVSSVGKKIEVIEFFMYHCPACNMLEPALLDWVKKQGDNVQFKRIHVPHNGAMDAEAHLFLTLEALGLETNLHSKVLHTWHVEHRQLLKDEDNLDWAIKNGLDKEKFLAAYNSFTVMSKLQNLARISANYQVDSTPTLIVDGHYLTSMSQLDKSNSALQGNELIKATFQVMDALVVKAQAEKK
jgi:thiol:disulfide interchange protein DsbA